MVEVKRIRGEAFAVDFYACSRSAKVTRKENILAQSKLGNSSFKLGHVEIHAPVYILAFYDIGDSHKLDYLQLFVTGNNESQYVFGPTPYPIAVSSQYNPGITWEETTTYNVGMDLGLYSRVTASIDAFYKDSQKLLVQSALPDGSNFSNSGYQNIGSMTTKGIELGVNAD
ncbi:MAG: TonB-dependent receptor, partial [Proteobacteria bacterium]